MAVTLECRRIGFKVRAEERVKVSRFSHSAISDASDIFDGCG